MNNPKLIPILAVLVVVAFTCLIGCGWPLLSAYVLDAVSAGAEGMRVNSMLYECCFFAMIVVGIPMGVHIGQIVSKRLTGGAWPENSPFWLALSCIPVAIIFFVDNDCRLITRNPAAFFPDIGYFLLVQALPILWFNYNVSSLIRRKRWS